MLLYTRLALRRRLIAWREKARAAAERLHAHAERLTHAGMGDQALVWEGWGYKALLYVQQCEMALARLDMAR
jgi:hypothetical protein